VTAANGARVALAGWLSTPLLRARWFGRVLGPTVDLCCLAGPRRALLYLRAERREGASDNDPDARVYEPIWREAAEALGASVHARGSGYLEISRDDRRTLVWRNLVELDDPVTMRLAGDKPAVHRLFAAAGLPSPEFASFAGADLAGAIEFLEDLGVPCVVKPAFGTGRGRGVTCGVSSRVDLRRAAVWASRWAPELLIERQGDGSEYRVLALDGEVLDVLRRRPPRVTGDGRSTIAELIDAENRRRAHQSGASGLFAISTNLDCMLALRSAGATLASVPAAGEVLTVKHTANENGPEDNESVIDLAGPAFLDDMRAAASAIGLRLASLEVITSDLGQSLARSGGMIVEVNATPGLHYHYQLANGTPAVPVAIPILRTLLEGDRARNGNG
jgi:D-alanine-D-alanine ligase-like ATP-grasp enzyme